MILHILSDLHLEHFPYQISKEAIEKSDVIILAGDISEKPSMVGTWLNDCGVPRTKPVLYIYGNHEFYDSNMFSYVGRSFIKRTNYCYGLNSWGKLKLFDENENHIIIGDTMFVGATLWTNFSLLNYSKKEAFDIARKHIPDYTYISYDGNRTLEPEDILKVHTEQLERIYTAFEGWKGKRVVISHHLPSPMCIDPKFKTSPLNHCYASNLHKDILDLNVDLWIHGHTHSSSEVSLDKCKIVCNARGYASERAVENPNFNPNYLVKI